MADGALALPTPFETTDVHIPIFPVIANGNGMPAVVNHKLVKERTFSVPSERSWAPKYGDMYYSQPVEEIFWFDGYDYVMLDRACWHNPKDSVI